MHNFLPEQPDLNLHNVEVQNALLEVTKFWLDRGIDGFRLDAINCGMHDPRLRDNPPAKAPFRSDTRPCFMQEPKYNMCHDDMPQVLERLRVVTDTYGEILTVAEVGTANPLPIMKDYTLGSTRLNTAYGFEFLGTPDLVPERVIEILEGWPGEPGEGWPSWAFSNHDAPRVASRWLQDVEHDRRVRLIALVQISLRGNLFIYQGEELGLTQGVVPYEKLQDPEAFTNWPHTLGRDGARTPMPWKHNENNLGFSCAEPWLPVQEAHELLAVALQESSETSILNYYRELIALRKELPALRFGELEFLKAPKGVLAFVRTSETQRIYCAFNLAGKEVQWTPKEAGTVKLAAAVGAGAEGGAIPSSLDAYSGYIGVAESV